ncbi:MAG: hypothetical protein ACI9K9_001000, partial [Neolewinella sp.]
GWFLAVVRTGKRFYLVFPTVVQQALSDTTNQTER